MARTSRLYKRNDKNIGVPGLSFRGKGARIGFDIAFAATEEEYDQLLDDGYVEVLFDLDDSGDSKEKKAPAKKAPAKKAAKKAAPKAEDEGDKQETEEE